MLLTAPTSTAQAAGAPASPSAATPMRKPALPALTGLRTFLALLIVLFHFTPEGLSHSVSVGGRTVLLTLYPLVDNGYVFVSFFFLISGYILAYNYLDRLDQLSLADFWVARLSRLYPVYLFALLLFLPMLVMEWHVRSRTDFWEGTLLTLGLMQGWFPNLATFWNVVAWTLSCEIALYAVFPWLLRAPWPVKPWRLIALMLGFWAIGLTPHWTYLLTNPDHLPAVTDHTLHSRFAAAMGLAGVHLHLAVTNRYSSSTWVNWLKFTPLPYMCTFLAGMALGKLQSVIHPTSQQRALIALTGFALAFVGFYRVLPHVPYIVVHGGFLTPVFAVIILGLSGPSWIARPFSWKPLVTVGASSYCLYLLHFNTFVLIHSHHLPERLHVARFDPWISYAFLVVFAVLMRNFFEHPLQLAIGRWWKRRKAVKMEV
jgi:peptidoglycan/LPS O-acetylase OafA/YrhL